MAKYSKGAQKGVKSAMKRMEKGTLRSGGSGKKVTNPKQAIAIGLSEAKKKGAKVPKKKSAAKKTTVKKPAAKKAAPKKASAIVKKRSSAKKTPVKKATAKKAAPKKAAPKKAVAKKIVQRKRPTLKPDPVPSASQAPPMSELSEEMHEKAVHEEKEKQSMMQSAHAEELMEKKEDPIMAFDMHMAQKATSKGDRNNKLRISSTGQRPIRPSGKKPLWRK